MSIIAVKTVEDKSINLFYEDYGSGRPVILIHGWPLTHRAWEPQMEALVSAGYRVIAYDRRGFGQSDKPWSGYDYDTLAADLKGLIEALDLNDAVIAGFSMGGGEVARYLGQYSAHRLSAAMLISAVTPYMLKTDDNPQGVPMKIFDDMRKNVKQDRFAFIAKWQKDFTNYSKNKDTVSEAFLDYLWQQTLAASPKAMHDCITSFGETDFRDDVKKIELPLLIVHGEDDQICPIEVCGERTAKLAPHAQFKIIKKAPHGLNITHKDQLNTEMLTFLNSL